MKDISVYIAILSPVNKWIKTMRILFLRVAIINLLSKKPQQNPTKFILYFYGSLTNEWGK